jgi:hypothetical protein
MKIKTICALAILFMFFMATSAFSLQYTFHPRVSVTQEYTSNVFLSADNEEDDYITILSPGFTAAALGKSSGLEISYDPSYAKYYDFHENDTWRHAAELMGWSDLTKSTRFEISNSFLRTEDPLEEEEILALRDGDVIQEGDPTIRTSRDTYYRNRASARLAHQFGREDSVYAGFTYGLRRSDDDQEEDNDHYSPSVGLNYWFVPKFGVQSNATYTKADFDRDADYIGDGTDDFDNYAGMIRLIGRTSAHFSVFAQHNQVYRDFDGDDDDYVVYAPSAGFLYMVEEGLNLRLGAGYFYVDIDNDEDEQGIFGNGQIDKTWTSERGSLTLAALTGLDQSNYGAENVGLEKFAGVQGSAVYRLARTVSWDINGSYRYSDVIGDADSGDEDSGSNVHRIRAGSGFTFEPLRWMAIRLGYNFNKVNSDNDADEYDEHRGLINITLTPSQPYRSGTY